MPLKARTIPVGLGSSGSAWLSWNLRSCVGESAGTMVIASRKLPPGCDCGIELGSACHRVIAARNAGEVAATGNADVVRPGLKAREHVGVVDRVGPSRAGFGDHRAIGGEERDR